MKDILKETKAIRFEGNNYSDEWKKEAINKRKLFFAETTPEVYDAEINTDVIELYKDLGVLTERELKSRVEIRHIAYANTKLIELQLAARMVRTDILPAIELQLEQLGAAFGAVKAAKGAGTALANNIMTLDKLYTEIVEQEGSLNTFITKTEAIEDFSKQAYVLATKGLAALQSLRDAVDAAELLVADEFWGLPTYDQLLSDIKH